MENWQIYLSFIPSIAVILTGVNRLALGITDEINLRLLPQRNTNKEIIALKVKQLKRLSIAVTLMYLALSILVMSALLAGNHILGMMYQNIPIFVSISLFFTAIGYLIRFSYASILLLNRQFDGFEKEWLKGPPQSCFQLDEAKGIIFFGKLNNLPQICPRFE